MKIKIKQHTDMSRSVCAVFVLIQYAFQIVIIKCYLNKTIQWSGLVHKFGCHKINKK